MAKKNKKGLEKTLTGEEAERLFARVDETGHDNEQTARHQHRRRIEKGQGVLVDPLSEDDPSGSTVGKAITRTAVGFVLIFLAIVVIAQVSCGVVRRANTANLSENVNVESVASALRGGVEWGNGFTQFPEDFSVQEADESAHRVEVTVVDTSSKDALECFSGSQIQATAFSVNALLNPNINTVIYHVNVHFDDKGEFQQSQLFGFLKPTGAVRTFMTFIWTKTTTEDGVRFNCTITGVDTNVQAELRERITSSFTPQTIISYVLGDSSEESSSATSTEKSRSKSRSKTEESSAAVAATTEQSAAATSSDAAEESSAAVEAQVAEDASGESEE